MDCFNKGDLVRWTIGHATYAAHPEKLIGADPIYKYGIVMQVSEKDPLAIVVHSYGSDEYRLIILNGSHDTIEVISKGGFNG